MKKILVVLIFITSITLNSIGIRWTLPNKERMKYYSSDVEQFYGGSKDNFPFENAPLSTSGNDEESVFYFISKMDPKKTNFNSGEFIKTAHIYSVAIALKICEILKIVKIRRDIKSYFNYPEEIAKLYLVGRYLSAILGSLVCVIIFILCSRFYNSSLLGILTSISLACSPVFVMFSHIMQCDILQLFFLYLAIFFIFKCMSEKRIIYYVFSGMFSGLASTAKTPSGLVILLVPIINLVEMVNDRKINEKMFNPKFSRKLVNEMRKLIISFSRKNSLFSYIGFIGGFFIGCPYLFLSFSEILPRAKSIFGAIMIQTPFYFPENSFIFYFKRGFQEVVGFPFTVLFIISFIYITFKGNKFDKVLLIWISTYILHLFISKQHASHYLLPVIPSFFILSFRFLFLLRKKHLKMFVLIYLASFLYSLFATLLILKAFTSETIMNKSAKWIQNNIKENSTIALAQFPHAFTPPLNHDKYKLIFTAFDKSKIINHKPDYFIFSNVEFSSGARKYVLYSPKIQLNFIKNLFKNGEVTENLKYKIYKVFETEVKIFNLLDNKKLYYFNRLLDAKIYIFKKL